MPFDSSQGSVASLETKAAFVVDSLGRRWNPVLHPRDSKGRFIETGGIVRVGFGGLGKVTRALMGNKVEVEMQSDHSRRTVDARQLTMVRRPNGAKPTKDARKVAQEDAEREQHPNRGDGIVDEDPGRDDVDLPTDDPEDEDDGNPDDDGPEVPESYTPSREQAQKGDYVAISAKRDRDGVPEYAMAAVVETDEQGKPTKVRLAGSQKVVDRSALPGDGDGDTIIPREDIGDPVEFERESRRGRSQRPLSAEDAADLVELHAKPQPKAQRGAPGAPDAHRDDQAHGDRPTPDAEAHPVKVTPEEITMVKGDQHGRVQYRGKVVGKITRNPDASIDNEKWTVKGPNGFEKTVVSWDNGTQVLARHLSKLSAQAATERQKRQAVPGTRKADAPNAPNPDLAADRQMLESARSAARAMEARGMTPRPVEKADLERRKQELAGRSDAKSKREAALTQQMLDLHARIDAAEGADEKGTPDADRPLAVGDRVDTEYGPGTVSHASDRSIGVNLDNDGKDPANRGQKINVQRGTPGEGRIKRRDPAKDQAAPQRQQRPAPAPQAPAPAAAAPTPDVDRPNPAGIDPTPEQQDQNAPTPTAGNWTTTRNADGSLTVHAGNGSELGTITPKRGGFEGRLNGRRGSNRGKTEQSVLDQLYDDPGMNGPGAAQRHRDQQQAPAPAPVQQQPTQAPAPAPAAPAPVAPAAPDAPSNDETPPGVTRGGFDAQGNRLPDSDGIVRLGRGESVPLRPAAAPKPQDQPSSVNLPGPRPSRTRKGAKPTEASDDLKREVAAAQSTDELQRIEKAAIREWANREGSNAERDSIMDTINARWRAIKAGDDSRNDRPSRDNGTTNEGATSERREPVRRPDEAVLRDVPAEPREEAARPREVLPADRGDASREGARPDGDVRGDRSGGRGLPDDGGPARDREAAGGREGAGRGPVQPAEGARDRGRGNAGGSDSGSRESGVGARRGEQAEQQPDEAAPRFKPSSQDDLAPKGDRAKAAANVEALETLRQIQAENRPATPAEQAKLARWGGWGAAWRVFEPQKYPEYRDLHDRMRPLLNDKEWAAAKENALNAHYTDASYVQTMWEAVRALGFDGGNVLEPGSGAGTFIGFAPDDAHMTGIELDPTSAAISRLLYPDANVRREGFEQTKVPDGSFDLTIGNVPFGDLPFVDKENNPHKHSLHNAAIIKSLKKTRPGGLVAVLTSHHTMDADGPKGTQARQDMADLGDLIGAVRLPSRAHDRAAGTAVVTDLLVFRRREDGTPYAGRQFVESSKIPVANGEAPISSYFQNNPDDVLGDYSLGGLRASDLQVNGNPNAGEDFKHAVDRVVEQAKQAGYTATGSSQSSKDNHLDLLDPDSNAHEGMIREGTEVFERTVTHNADGSEKKKPLKQSTKFVQVENGREVPFWVGKEQAKELSQLLKMRDLTRALLAAETASDKDTPKTKALREALNKQYDAYVSATVGGKPRGPINRFTWARTGRIDPETGEEKMRRNAPQMGGFRDDPSSALVYALEKFDPENQTARKASIFTERTVAKREVATKANTPQDAVALSLETDGEVTLPRVAQLLGVPEDEAEDLIEGHVFPDHDGSGRLVPTSEYLSGDVRKKLKAARAAAEEDPSFLANVAALEAVVPEDLTAGEIDGRLGAAWIGEEDVQQFLREILHDPHLRVEHPGGNVWGVSGRQGGVAATEEWGTTRKNAVDIAEKLLTGKPIVVEDTIKGGYGEPDRRVVNKTETEAAVAKAEEMQERFAAWLWEDPARAARLQDEYNDKFNGIVLREYDTSPLALPGMSKKFTLRGHQNAAIRRIVAEPSALLAHEVGAGKTLEMVGGVMELRRLGLARKPAIVVPNHMLEQFSREFLEAYPNANILAAGSFDLSGDGRRRFVARAATGDWDAVILTQGGFKKLGMSKENQQAYLESKIADLEEQVRRQEERGERNSITLKDLQKLLKTRKAKIQEKLDKLGDEEGVSFEEAGIDYLMVDEAHMYKNLTRWSNRRELSIEGSDQADDLDMKIHHLRKNTASGRVVTFATATPIANSIGEAYTMQQYLRPDLLEESGIPDFDTWVSTFGTTVTEMEVAPTGGLRMKERFKKFRNVPELLKMFRVATDVKTAEDLGLPVPVVRNKGDEQNVVVPASDEFVEWNQEALDRMAEDDSPAAVLKYITAATQASLDMRLVGADGPPDKLAAVASQIATVHEKTKDREYPIDPKNPSAGMQPRKGSLQIVFSDTGTPNADGRFSAYDALRDMLVKDHGFSRDSVRFIHEADNDQKKAQLFQEARDGKIAVLIGSTAKMGVGTNVQDRAVALHHLDCPWRPADLQQRDGRIIRQGNLNGPWDPSRSSYGNDEGIEVYRYMTEGSIDAYRWQTVKDKSIFIGQMMRGRLDVREIDDLSEQSMSLAVATAASQGNPHMMEKAKTDEEVKKFTRLDRKHGDSQRSLLGRVENTEAQIKGAQDTAAALTAAIGKREDLSDDKWRVKVGGKTYAKKAEGGEALAKQLAEVAKQRFLGTEGDEVKVADFGGFPVMARPVNRQGQQKKIEVRLDGIPGSASEIGAEVTPGSAMGVFTRLENRLGELEQRRDSALAREANAREELARIKARIGVESPYKEPLEDAKQKAALLGELVEATSNTNIPPEDREKRAAKAERGLADLNRKIQDRAATATEADDDTTAAATDVDAGMLTGDKIQVAVAKAKEVSQRNRKPRKPRPERTERTERAETDDRVTITPEQRDAIESGDAVDEDEPSEPVDALPEAGQEILSGADGRTYTVEDRNDDDGTVVARDEDGERVTLDGAELADSGWTATDEADDDEPVRITPEQLEADRAGEGGDDEPPTVEAPASADEPDETPENTGDTVVDAPPATEPRPERDLPDGPQTDREALADAVDRSEQAAEAEDTVTVTPEDLPTIDGPSAEEIQQARENAEQAALDEGASKADAKRAGDAAAADAATEGADTDGERVIPPAPVSDEHADSLDYEPKTPTQLEGERFPLTPQQQKVADAVVADGKDTKVEAKAGAGKTSTLEAIARRFQVLKPGTQIAYIAFNKSVQVEAEGRMPENTEPRTGHSISFAWRGRKWTDAKFKNPAALRRADEIAKHLGITSDLADLDPAQQAQAVMRAVGKYANSAEDEVELKHFTGISDLKPAEQAKLLAYAKKAWADLEKIDGKINVNNDHIRKMWALSRPDLTKPGSGLRKPATVLFLDEAQDTPPVLAKVVADQKMQKVIVGDADQAIYGFTGATDYLSTAQADVSLPLTKSWRFGPKVADIGNRFLQILGSKDRVEGGGSGSEIVKSMDAPDAILVRSNGGMIGEIAAEQGAGRVVAVPKGTKQDLLSLVESARYLKGEGRAPTAMHEDLAPFRTWEEFEKAALKGDDQKLSMLKRIIDQNGLDGLERIIRGVEELTDATDDPLAKAKVRQEDDRAVIGVGFVVNKNLTERTGRGLRSRGWSFKGDLKEWSFRGDKDAQDAALAEIREALAGEDVKPDVVVSTAHKAKGLEWERVKIGADFRGPEQDEDGNVIFPSPEELKLAYVAVTRAEKELDPGSLAWVYDYSDPNGEGDGPKLPDDDREVVSIRPADLPTVDGPEVRDDDEDRDRDRNRDRNRSDVPGGAPDGAPDGVPDASPDAPEGDTPDAGDGDDQADQDRSDDDQAADDDQEQDQDRDRDRDRHHHNRPGNDNDNDSGDVPGGLPLIGAPLPTSEDTPPPTGEGRQGDGESDAGSATTTDVSGEPMPTEDHLKAFSTAVANVLGNHRGEPGYDDAADSAQTAADLIHAGQFGRAVGALDTAIDRGRGMSASHQLSAVILRNRVARYAEANEDFIDLNGPRDLPGDEPEAVEAPTGSRGAVREALTGDEATTLDALARQFADGGNPVLAGLARRFLDGEHLDKDEIEQLRRGVYATASDIDLDQEQSRDLFQASRALSKHAEDAPSAPSEEEAALDGAEATEVPGSELKPGDVFVGTVNGRTGRWRVARQQFNNNPLFTRYAVTPAEFPDSEPETWNVGKNRPVKVIERAPEPVDAEDAAIEAEQTDADRAAIDSLFTEGPTITPAEAEAAGVPVDLHTVDRTPEDFGSMLLPGGTVARTTSGRLTTPFPATDFSTNRRASSARRRIDQWLLDNARAEAEARRLNTFLPEKAGNVTPAEREMAEEILFDPSMRDLDGNADTGILKPLVRDEDVTPEATPEPEPVDTTPEPEPEVAPDEPAGVLDVPVADDATPEPEGPAANDDARWGIPDPVAYGDGKGKAPLARALREAAAATNDEDDKGALHMARHALINAGWNTHGGPHAQGEALANLDQRILDTIGASRGDIDKRVQAVEDLADHLDARGFGSTKVAKAKGKEPSISDFLRSYADGYRTARAAQAPDATPDAPETAGDVTPEAPTGDVTPEVVDAPSVAAATSTDGLWVPGDDEGAWNVATPEWGGSIVPTDDGDYEWSVALPDGTVKMGRAATVDKAQEAVVDALYLAAADGQPVTSLPGRDTEDRDRRTRDLAETMAELAPSETPADETPSDAASEEETAAAPDIDGVPAGWVPAGSLEPGDIAQVDGDNGNGSATTRTGHVLGTPEPVTVHEPGKPVEGGHRVVVGEDREGGGDRGVVLTEEDAMAARAERDDENGNRNDPTSVPESEILSGQVGDTVPVDSNGVGVYPGSIVTDRGGRQGRVNETGDMDVSVRWEGKHEDEQVRPGLLTVDETQHPRPAGWNRFGQRIKPGQIVELPDGRRGTVEAVDGDTAEVLTPGGAVNESTEGVKVVGRVADDAPAPEVEAPRESVFNAPPAPEGPDVRPTDPIKPDPLPEGVSGATVNLKPDQLAALNGLGLDIDAVTPTDVQQAAARVRHGLPVSTEQAMALAGHLRDLAGQGGLPAGVGRTLRRVANRLDAAGARARGERPEADAPEANAPERITVGDVVPGDTIAVPNPETGSVEWGEVVTKTPQVTREDGTTNPAISDTVVETSNGDRIRVPLDAGAEVYRLPDVPEDPETATGESPISEDRPFTEPRVAERLDDAGQAVADAATDGPASSLEDLAEQAHAAMENGDDAQDQENAGDRFQTALEQSGVDPETAEAVREAAEDVADQVADEVADTVLATVDDAEPLPGESDGDAAARTAQRIREDAPGQVDTDALVAEALDRAEGSANAPSEQQVEAARAGTVDAMRADLFAYADELAKQGDLVSANALSLVAARLAGLPEGVHVEAAVQALAMGQQPQQVASLTGRVRAAFARARQRFLDRVKALMGTGRKAKRSFKAALAAARAAWTDDDQRDVDALVDHAARHLAQGGDREAAAAVPGEPTGFTERVAFWRNQLGNPAEFGRTRGRSRAYRALTLDALRSGRQVRADEVDGLRLDRASDGGPGRKALADLAAVHGLGGALNDEVHARVRSALPDLGSDPAATVREARRYADSLAADERGGDKKLAKLRAKAKADAEDKAKRYADALAESTLAVLGEARQMGPNGAATLNIEGRGNGAEEVQALRWAEKHLPTDWLAAAGTVEAQAGRRTKAEDGTLTVAPLGEALRDGAGEYGASALAALARHMEQTIPGLSEAAWAYHYARTSDGPVGSRTRRGKNALGRLANLFPATGISRDAVARGGSWPTPWLGQEDAEGKPYWWPLGIQALFTGGDWFLDDDMRKMTMGLLAYLERSR